MCNTSNNTKQRIADAVEKLICAQPGGKITVQQIMELTQMNRQSFYYHYQDVPAVLERIVLRKFCLPMAFNPREDVETWCERGLRLLEENKTLLRRISRELGNAKMYALVAPVVWPQVERLIPVKAGQDLQLRQRAVDSISKGLLCSVTGIIVREQSEDIAESMESLRAVLTVLGAKSTPS